MGSLAPLKTLKCRHLEVQSPDGLLRQFLPFELTASTAGERILANAKANSNAEQFLNQHQRIDYYNVQTS